MAYAPQKSDCAILMAFKRYNFIPHHQFRFRAAPIDPENHIGALTRHRIPPEKTISGLILPIYIDACPQVDKHQREKETAEDKLESFFHLRVPSMLRLVQDNPGIWDAFILPKCHKRQIIYLASTLTWISLWKVSALFLIFKTTNVTSSSCGLPLAHSSPVVT